MTTSTDTQPLNVGDRVSFRGALATVVEVEERSSGSEHALRLLKYDDGQNLSDGYSWGDSNRGPGRYWWVTPDNANLERVAPEPYAPRLGDRVTVSLGANVTSALGVNRWAGTVYATYGVNRETTTDVWVGGTDFGYTYAYPFDQVGETHTKADDVPAGVVGHWFTVSSVQPDTSEEAPSEAAEAPAESPEVTALRLRAERAEALAESRREAIVSFERDLAIIGDSLKETADRQEWCGQYEEHLEELLGKLSGYSDDILREHAERAQDYTVTVTFTTSVRATDRNDAIEQAQESAMEYHTYLGDWSAEEE
jgi:hypothetical protein